MVASVRRFLLGWKVLNKSLFLQKGTRELMMDVILFFLFHSQNAGEMSLLCPYSPSEGTSQPGEPRPVGQVVIDVG